MYSIIVVIFGVIPMTIAQGPTHGKVVMCPIMTQSALEAIGSQFSISGGDWTMCSHIIVTDDPIATRKWDDLTEAIKLKDKYPHLKVILGRNIETIFQMYLTHATAKSDQIDAKRTALGMCNFVKTSNLDGMDLYAGDIWETYQRIVFLCVDPSMLFLFLRDLKDCLGDLLLTSSFSTTFELFSQDFDFVKYSAPLDFINVLQFRIVSHETMLVNNTIDQILIELSPSNVQQKIDKLIDRGIPTSKLVFGVNFGGVEIKTTVDASNNPSTEVVGFIGYGATCHLPKNDESTPWTKSNDVKTKLSIINTNTKEPNEKRSIILYGSGRTIANFVLFALRRNLAGISVYSIHFDDFEGQCNADEDRFDDFKAQSKHFKAPSRSRKDYSLTLTVNEALSIDPTEFIEENKVPAVQNHTIEDQANEISDNKIGPAASNGLNTIQNTCHLAFVGILIIFRLLFI